MTSRDLKLKANFYLDKSNIEIMFTEEPWKCWSPWENKLFTLFFNCRQVTRKNKMRSYLRAKIQGTEQMFKANIICIRNTLLLRTLVLPWDKRTDNLKNGAIRWKDGSIYNTTNSSCPKFFFKLSQSVNGTNGYLTDIFTTESTPLQFKRQSNVTQPFRNPRIHDSFQLRYLLQFLQQTANLV